MTAFVDSLVAPEKKTYSIGVDLGTSKITISRSDLSKPTVCPEVIADMMDIRNIPNILSFPTTSEQTRMFGNETSTQRCFAPEVTSEEDLTKIYTIKIADKDYELPLYIIETMIMDHVRKIIDYRTEFNDKTNDKTKNKIKSSVVVIVPSRSSSAKDIFFESLGAKLQLDNLYDCVKTISSRNALIFNYIERYVLSVDSSIDIPMKTVLIIDMGQSRFENLKFEIHRTGGEIYIDAVEDYKEHAVSGNLIDDVFISALAQRVRGSFPSFKINKADDKKYEANRSFRSAVSKLKHQLSTNQTVLFALQGIEQDISFPVTRNEYNEILCAHGKIFGDPVVTPNHIELIGGCARIPFFREKLKEMYKDATIGTMNIDESVANGACVYGWLLQNEDIAKTIHIIRKVKNQVKINYHLITSKSKYHDHPVFNEYAPILTHFPGSDRPKSKDIPMFTIEDINVVRIPITSRSFNDIIVTTGNLHMYIELTDVAGHHTPIVANQYIDIVLKYGLDDIIEILDIKYSNGVSMKYDCHVETKDGVMKSRAELIVKYTDIEKQIAHVEKIIVQRQDFINFMESYFLNKDAVNAMINKIAREQIQKKIYKNAEGKTITAIADLPVTDVDIVVNTQIVELVSPLKEIYEFYQFCRNYCDETDEKSKRSKKRRIENILHNEHALEQMMIAKDIIKNIQKKYS